MYILLVTLELIIYMKEEALNSQIPEAYRSRYKIKEHWALRQLEEYKDWKRVVLHVGTSNQILERLQDIGLFWIK